MKKINKLINFIKKEQLPKYPENRSVGLDAVKVLACIFVVVMHSLRKTHASVAGFEPLYYMTRVAMPLFFIVVGYIQLNKEQIQLKYIIRKNLNIIVKVSCWVTLFHVFKNVISSGGGYIYDLTRCYFQKGNLSVFWFFGTMMLMYLILPVLNIIFKKKANAVLITSIFICICTAIDIVSNIYASHHNVFLQSYVIQTFRVWTWINYVCIGGCIKKFGITEKIISFDKMAITLVTITVIAVGYEYYLFKVMSDVVNAEYFYDSPIMMLWSALTFIFLVKIPYGKNMSKFVRFMSYNFVGIYAVHNIVAKYAGRFFSQYGYIGSILCILSVFSISLIVSVTIIKIPYLNRITKI